MKWIKRLSLALLLLYVLFCGVLYLAQEKLIFRPRMLPADYVFGEGQEINLETPDGILLNALAFTRPNPDGVVLYLHGNKGSNQRSLRQTRDIRETNNDLYLFDYRGYGKSGGSIVSEAQFYADAQLVYNYLAERYGEERITLVGYSLGTGMASYLAAHNHPKHCVLVAPYASMTGMKNLFMWIVPDFILKYPLNNVANVEQTNCPVTVLHGQDDGLIPFTMAEEIKEAAPERVNLIALPGTGHRGAILHPRFEQSMREILGR